jgi:pimeloyl-ACP methyl ester carboxylesterase
MKTKNYTDGIRITVPAGLIILDPIQTGRQNRSLRKLPSNIAMPGETTQNQNDPVAAALEKTGFEMVRSVIIAPELKSTTRLRKVLTDGSPAEVVIGLKGDENAILLTEQDGMYQWHFAEQTQTSPSTRKRGNFIENTDKELIFRLDDTIYEGKENTTRSFIGTLLAPIKAYILKFTSSLAVTQAIKYLEQDNEERLVQLNRSFYDWQPLASLAELELNSQREPKVLFFIHGTFSSTTGAFGMLAELPWGKKFLEAALSHYDAVIGYDHRTLVKDPAQNAAAILKILKTHNGPNISIDIVAHSRGGLIARTLIEKLLPSSNTAVNINKAILVGATNGGTLFAEPDNWKELIDFYTNIVAGTARAVGFIAPQSKPVSGIITEVIKNLGSFVKYCASAAVTDNLVPGLAAMEPDGKFIVDINKKQDGQVTAENSPYYIISSAFKPKLSGDHEPKELPKRFLTYLGASLMNRFMKQSNDLVVNTAAMSTIDIGSGDFIKGRYEFGENPQVYHTNYFTRPEVADILVKWLALTEAPPTTSVHPILPAHETVITEEKSGTEIALAADTDFIVFDAMSKVKGLRSSIKKFTPSYVVLQQHKGNKIINYAFKGEEAIRIIGQRTYGSIFDTFQLEEVSPTPYASVIPSSTGAAYKPLTRGKTRILVNGSMPVGVVEAAMPVNVQKLAELTRIISRPTSIENKIIRRRALPTFRDNDIHVSGTVFPSKDISFNTPETGETEAVKPESSPFFRIAAEMDNEFENSTDLTVTVTRDELQKTMSDLWEEAAFAGEESKKLIITVLPKKNITLAEGSGRYQIDLPEAGKPIELFFTLEAAGTGEGEVWVVARQGPIPLAKLVLKPQVTTDRPATDAKLKTAQDAVPPVVSPGLNQLWIEEEITQQGTVYKYNVYSDKLNINAKGISKVIQGDRQKYVARLYDDIENRRIRNSNDRKNFEEELRAFGADLYRELIPDNIQEILWNKRTYFDSIQVISSEPFIPWEFLHLVEPKKNGMPAETLFLGQLGLVRWLEGAGINGFPPKEILVREGKVKYIIPEYLDPAYRLPATLLERDYLIKTFNAQATPPKSSDVKEIIQRPGLFDILHFACHGEANSTKVSEAALLMQGTFEDNRYELEFFWERTARNFSNLAATDNSPIVVVNACQTGRAGYKLTTIGGFSNAFLSAGAGVFIGTLWSVGDSPAFFFIKALYDALLDGKTLAVAANEGRNAARENDPSTWLAYEVYGHPQMILKTNIKVSKIDTVN